MSYLVNPFKFPPEKGKVHNTKEAYKSKSQSLSTSGEMSTLMCQMGSLFRKRNY